MAAMVIVALLAGTLVRETAEGRASSMQLGKGGCRQTLQRWSCRQPRTQGGWGNFFFGRAGQAAKTASEIGFIVGKGSNCDNAVMLAGGIPCKQPHAYPGRVSKW